MKYLSARFIISTAPSCMQVCKDLLADMAGEAGFESFEETGDGLIGYVQTTFFDRTLLDTLIQDFPIEQTTITYTVSEMEDKDWNENWEEAGFEPISIARRCVIYDAKHTDMATETEKSVQDGRLRVFIEARQAFGTGTHQTTRMMTTALLNMDLKGKRVLDCGCGTGILAIVASRCGCSEAMGYDIDEWSVNNAMHNSVVNGVENLSVLLGDAGILTPEKGLFDVVLANINRNILLQDMPRFVERMSGTAILAMSGFLVEDCGLIEQKALSLGLKRMDMQTEDGWACMSFMR